MCRGFNSLRHHPGRSNAAFLFTSDVKASLRAIILTGLAACSLKVQAQSDTVSHKHRYRYAAPVVLSLGAVAAWRDDGFFSRGAVYDWRQSHVPDFSHRADNYMQFLPIAAVFILDAGHSGREGKKSLWLDHAVLLAGSQLVMSAIVYPVKELSNVERPNGRNDKSFPSGHTAQAFMAATFLHRTYGQRSIWYSVAGYSVAAATGAFRILNNAHWLTDVLAGAAVGILSVNLVQDFRIGRRRDLNLTMAPVWHNGPGLGLNLRPSYGRP